VPTALESVAACALAAPPEDACRRVLERVRHDFDADVAVLAACDGAAGAFVDRAPAAAALEPDADLLAAAFGQGEPVALHGRESERLLAIGLDLAEAGRWCLALGRAAGAPWTTRDERALAERAPGLRLAFANGLLRRRLATERREAVAVRERLLGSVSHELRNPLAPILMWTTTLRRLRPEDRDVARAADAIEQAIEVARGVLDDLAWIRRLESGRVELERRPIDLARLVAEEADRREVGPRARIRVATTVPPEPVPVEGDAARLARAIGAVLDNAIKFSPPDGTVRVRVVARSATAEVTVADEGPGIDRETLPELFAPFAPSHGARSGLGVGLAIARSLVALHGGHMEASSPAGGGTSIVIALPLLASDAGRSARA